MCSLCETDSSLCIFPSFALPYSPFFISSSSSAVLSHLCTRIADKTIDKQPNSDDIDVVYVYQNMSLNQQNINTLLFKSH